MVDRRRTLRSLISGWIPLSMQMLLASFVIGFAVWWILDDIQDSQVHTTFISQLHSELRFQVERDRGLFDRHVQSINHVGALAVSLPGFAAAAARINTQPARAQPLLHRRPPGWLPGRSVLRNYFFARFALLLDDVGQLREVYIHHGINHNLNVIPLVLRKPSPVLRKLSHSQSYMTLLEGVPYVLSEHTLRTVQGRAVLLLATPIDNEFLMGVRELKEQGTIMALIDSSAGRVVASSLAKAIPDGTALASLEDDYLVIGKSFFDYGASDLELEFSSFLPTARANELAEQILAQSERHRLILSGTLITAFVLLTLWISWRVKRLSRTVESFGRERLGMSSVERLGDELSSLEVQFKHLGEAVLNGREQLQRDAEEKLRLSRRVFEEERRSETLSALQAVTESLDVGVISDSGGQLSALNRLMEEFIADCGPIERFLLEGEEVEGRRRLAGCDGTLRTFQIKRHVALGARGLLVRDISSEVALEEERHLFASVPLSNPNPILRIDRDGRILYANAVCADILDVLEVTVGDTLPGDWCEAVRENIDAGLDEYLEFAVGERWYSFTTGLIEGSPYLYLYGLDITERKQVEQEMQLAAAITHNVNDGILVTDVNGHITSVNPAFSRISGYSEVQLLGHRQRYFYSQRHDASFLHVQWLSLQQEGAWQGEVWVRCHDGALLPCFTRISAIYDSQGQVSHFVSIYADFTEHKQAEEELTRLANHDPLTGLPNRRVLMDRLGHDLTLAQRQQGQLALLFADLDGFKEVNDRYGHEIGDLLLQEVARRLTACVRESDTVSRLGGDEFAIILQNISDMASVEEIMGHMLEQLSAPYQLTEHTAIVSASIGCAVYPQDGDGVEVLLRCADAAMYQAKQAGKNGWHRSVGCG